MPPHILLPQYGIMPNTFNFYTEIDTKPTALVERHGDSGIVIILQNKPWQLMHALEAFQVCYSVYDINCVAIIIINDFISLIFNLAWGVNL